jgi:hypothetical protein
MVARRLTLATLALLCALTGGLLFGSASSLAARGHAFGSSFGGKGSGEGQFDEPSGVAVSYMSGDVYVVDKGNNRVEYFSASGTYLGQFNGSGLLLNEGKAAGSGGLPNEISTGRFSSPEGIAIDNACQLHTPVLTEATTPTCAEFDPSNGDVYVADMNNQVVDKFSGAGEYIGQIARTPSGVFEADPNVPSTGLLGVAVDADGQVFVLKNNFVDDVAAGDAAEFNNGIVNAFVADKELSNILPSFPFGGATFAVNREDAFYVLDRNEEGSPYLYFLNKNATSGEGLFGVPYGEEEVTGVAADLSSDEVYVGTAGVITRFSANFGPTDGPLERFGTGDLSSGSGIGIGPKGQTIYVADSTADVVDIFVPEPPSAPTLSGSSVSDVTGEGATVESELNPHGASTKYHLEYGRCTTPTTCAGSPYEISTPVPDASVESSFEIQTIEVQAQGLQASTAYHARIVAANEFGSVEGEELTFNTQAVGSAGVSLADGRQWELVSPPNKHGALMLGIEQIGVIQAAASGDALSYLASSPIEAEPQGYTNLTNSQALGTRDASGWKSHDIAIANETQTSEKVGLAAEYPFFSEDLKRAVVQPLGGFIPASSPQALAPAEASEQTAFLRLNYDDGDLSQPCLQSQLHSCFRPLVTGTPGFANVPPGTEFGVGNEGPCPLGILCGPQFLGASTDARHVVLESLHTPLAEGSNAHLYEWSEGKLTPIPGIDWLGTGGGGGGTGAGGGGMRRHTISADGSRIIGQRLGDRHLYLRDMASNEEVMLDAVQGGLGGAISIAPTFQDASSDGSTIYFTDSSQLTADSHASEVTPDLYECEIVQTAGKLGCKLSDLTVPSGEKPGSVVGVVGTSEDGSWMYFVANGVLAPGATTGTCNDGSPNNDEQCNLYVSHGGVTQLVAIVSKGDLRAQFNGSTANASMRVSPNGQWMTFMSQRELTGYDNHDAITGTSDYEVYLYRAPSEDGAQEGKLVCASCNPTGARPVGVKIDGHVTLVASFGVWGGEQVAANLPQWTAASLGYNLYQPRYLSDGGRLFFNSSDALVPQDVNGNEDVYEYEPAGYTNVEGLVQCTSSGLHYSERSGGCVGLVSSGEAQGESAFLDASETGGDVFFLTSGQLAPQDYDTALDVYDAHECTTDAPCLPAPAAVAPPCDTGDSCKTPPSPQPAIYGAPASATFSGAGNLAPPSPVVSKRSVKCAKGKKLKHGRCVRARAKRKKAHKARRATTNRRAKR